MAYTLGIDLGTSSIKAAIFDTDTGQEVRSATAPADREMRRVSHRPGWTEQDPGEWVQCACDAVLALGAERLQRVKAVGIAYQMHGLVLVDRSLAPVRDSIIWSDSRAAECGARLASALEPGYLHRTLNRPGNFTLSKLKWVAENEPDVLARARWAMLPGDYLAAVLTGLPATTATGLSEMVGWDFAARCPADDVWEGAADLTLRPEIVPALGHQGFVVNSDFGLPAGIPVSYRAGDQPNNAVALGVLAPGEVAAVAGTSGVLYAVGDRPMSDQTESVNTFLHVNDSPEAVRLGVLLCINGAGSFYSWIRRMTGVAGFPQLNDLAASVGPGAGGLIALPYGNGAERSLGNRYLGASLVGLDVNRHGQGHLARAAQEGVAFAMKYGAEAMATMGIRITKVRTGSSSMFASPLFCQIVADTLGAQVELVQTDGALGAARAAAAGAGFLPSLESATASLVHGQSYDPVAGLYDKPYLDWRQELMHKLGREG